MAATYEYRITGLKKLPSLNGLNDVVTSVDLSIKANSGVEGNVDMDWFVTDIYLEQPVEESFTPFSELTEEEVINWVLPIHPVPTVIAEVERIVDSQINPKEHIQGPQLPWASGSITI